MIDVVIGDLVLVMVVVFDFVVFVVLDLMFKDLGLWVMIIDLFNGVI